MLAHRRGHADVFSRTAAPSKDLFLRPSTQGPPGRTSATMRGGYSARHRRYFRRLRRGQDGPFYDVVFYMPSIAPLVRAVPGPAPGGAETQVWMLCRQLARTGVRVALVVGDVVEFPDSVQGVTIIRRAPYLPGRSMMYKAREVGAVLRLVWQLPANTVVKRGYAHDAGLVGLAARARGRAFVYSSANVLDFAAWDRNRRLVSLSRLGALRLASTVVVQTTEQVGMCEQRLGKHPRLIRSLAELPEPIDSRSVEPEFFLWIGRVVPHKRPFIFLELAERLPTIQFKMLVLPEMAKSADLMAEVDRRVRGLPNLGLLPPRPRAAVGELMERSWAVVNTSDYEGMPNIFLEGWARGIPAVCLSHDPDGLIALHGLGVFTNGSTDDLAEACTSFIDGSFDRAAAASRCRQYVASHHAAAPVAASWAALLDLTARAVASPP
jgi:glycosyltransferase involved in cell wall biosynthesis